MADTPKVEPTDPSERIAVQRILRDRPPRGLPRWAMITLAVGAVAIIAAFRLADGPSRETAALTLPAPQPTQAAGATPEPMSAFPTTTMSPALARAIPLPPVGLLAPGSYFLVNPYVDDNPVRGCAGGCSDYRRITFDLPAGWGTIDGLVYKHLDQPDEVAFSAWTVDQVYADPCLWQGSALSPLDLVGHTHDEAGIVLLGDRDGGLANQARRGARARALTEATLGGTVALRIDLSVPAALDISTCDLGEFRSWTEWDVVDGANSHHAAGQLDTVFMVDVDRRPLVIDASHMPATSTRDLAELEDVLASMIIDR